MSANETDRKSDHWQDDEQFEKEQWKPSGDIARVPNSSWDNHRHVGDDGGRGPGESAPVWESTSTSTRRGPTCCSTETDVRKQVGLRADAGSLTARSMRLFAAALAAVETRVNS
jgi:hypothetical protein